jgi:hypothetical protein
MPISTRKIAIFIAVIVLSSCAALVATNFVTSANALSYTAFTYCYNGHKNCIPDSMPVGGTWNSPGFANRTYNEVRWSGGVSLRKMFVQNQYGSDTGWFDSRLADSYDFVWYNSGYYKAFCGNIGSNTATGVQCATNTVS